MISQQEYAINDLNQNKNNIFSTNPRNSVSISTNSINQKMQIYNQNPYNQNKVISCMYQPIGPQMKTQESLLKQIKMYDKKKTTKTQRKKIFTNEEDQKLIEAVEKLRSQDGFCWSQVSEIVGGGRTPRQCRERYKHYLDPEIKNPKWTIEEEILLEQKYAEYGPKWAIISKFFKSRTDVNVKNHWTILSQRIKKVLSGNYKNFSIPYVKTLNRLNSLHSKNALNKKNKMSGFNPFIFNSNCLWNHQLIPSVNNQKNQGVPGNVSDDIQKVEQTIDVLNENSEIKSSNDESKDQSQDDSFLKQFQFDEFDDDLNDSFESNEFNQNGCFYNDCSCSYDDM